MLPKLTPSPTKLTFAWAGCTMSRQFPRSDRKAISKVLVINYAIFYFVCFNQQGITMLGKHGENLSSKNCRHQCQFCASN